ncbi:LOW QUALITY PROTEIN: hypothetical protein PHMEG_00033175 [Phytophthora megakarya]|uniref:Eukaryotic/viral aspartic protease n=1 Tax=Phytophthora megakarya TaxID=4795 RepID=A0A225UU97_9STRA|nr:LOW QUALITY PROTEIN: hypothetical protein PHMEG_00033175 [Phytophthora megakarya]
MAKGSKSAVPATPMKSGGTRSGTSGHSEASYATPSTSRMTPITERAGSFDESADFSDAKEDDEGYLEGKAHVAEFSEGAVHTLARNLIEELEEVAGPEPANDSDDEGLNGGTRSKATGKRTTPASDTRPPINGDTPAVNKVLGRTLELMRTKSSWFPIFGSKLASGVDESRSRACDASRLHKHPTSRSGLSATPPSYGWKKKFRAAFSIEEIAPGRQVTARQAAGPADPSQVPLPMTPIKQSNGGAEDEVFGSKGTPYMHDSHMVTPRSDDR